MTAAATSVGFMEFPRDALERSVVARFEAIVDQFPHRVALAVDGTQVTYAALNGLANGLAKALLERRRSEPAPVAILMNDVLQQVAATLAILKAGDFYVILEPVDPAGRLRTLLEDAAPALVLCDAANRGLAEELVGDASRVLLVSDEVLNASTSSANPGLAIQPDALVNIMYTSGSTGRPKGALQTHRTLLHGIYTTTNRLSQSPDDRMALMSPMSVGVAASILFGGLLVGAAVLPFNVRRFGVGRLAEWLVAERISVSYSLPSVLRNTLLLLAPGQRLADLRCVKLGGEPLFRSDVSLFREHLRPDCLVQLVLGTTETYAITFNHLDLAQEPRSAILPVGRAEEDYEVVLVDESRQPVAGTGEVGEIVVRSEFLSPGYWRQPESTHAAFTDLGNQLREYRTGDLGRWLPDGNLEHLGRKDFALKVRGHLVSPTEVETALREQSAVADAAVIGYQGQPGHTRLLAYVVAAPGYSIEPARLREALGATLPDHMQPSSYVTLERLPLLPNGKVDVRALPAPETLPSRQEAHVAPRTPLEDLVAGIWSEVLRRGPISVEDDFAELGGDSLLAAQILSRVNAACGVEVPFSALFEARTVAALATAVGDSLATRVDPSELSRLLDEVESIGEERNG